MDFNKKLHKTTIESNILYVEAEHCIRVHRGFAVSINQIETVEGNSQGLRLTINNSDTTVPVSRKYIPIVRNYLTYIP